MAAYASIIMSKIMAATSEVKKGNKKCNQSAYADGVLSFYGASNKTDGLKYCHLTGWQGERSVKCAHLVPKSLESNDLAYLFGVRKIVLSEPETVWLQHYSFY
jgi:hypothetical protein